MINKVLIVSLSLSLVFCFPIYAEMSKQEEDEALDNIFNFDVVNPKAIQGDAKYQHRLAFLYRSGGFGRYKNIKDLKKALFWETKAAEQGYIPSQLELAELYLEGRYVIQDYKKAFYWLKLLAEKNNKFGQGGLGYIYSEGLGVSQDYVMAHMWINIAASNGHESAYKLRDEIAKNMTPEQILKAQRLAGEWAEDHK